MNLSGSGPKAGDSIVLASGPASGAQPPPAFLQAPPARGAAAREPRPSHLPGLGEGPWAVPGLPSPSFQMLLPDASKLLRPQGSDSLILALPSLGRGRAGMEPGTQGGPFHAALSEGWGKPTQACEPPVSAHPRGTRHSPRAARPPPRSSPDIFSSPGKETRRHQALPPRRAPSQPLGPSHGCAVSAEWPGHHLCLRSAAGGHASCLHASAGVNRAAVSWCLTRFSHSCGLSMAAPIKAVSGQSSQRTGDVGIGQAMGTEWTSPGGRTDGAQGRSGHARSVSTLSRGG